jgi:protein-disulfide isomerase
MAKQWQNLMRSKWVIWAGVGVVVVGIATPLLLLLPNRNQQSQAVDDLEAHQELVTEVISSMDRNALIAGSPTKGNLNAPIVLFKFSDFECPYCAVTAGYMKDFVSRNQADVLYIYKHFPLDQIHDEAIPSAKAAWAAQQQGQFWLYHDGLFANQQRMGEDLYVELAAAMNLDMEQFNRDRTSAEAEAAVQADLALAQTLELSGTPTFIMNDLLLPPGLPPQVIEDLFNQVNGMIEPAPQQE